MSEQPEFRIKSARVHYGSPVVEVEDTDIEHEGKRYRVDSFVSDGAPGSSAYVYASGILIKKNGELGGVRKSTIIMPLPPHIKEAFESLGGQPEVRPGHES